MKFDALWQACVQQNPVLGTAGRVAMPVEKFKKAMMLAYEKGHTEGMTEGMATSDVFNTLINPKGCK